MNRERFQFLTGRYAGLRIAVVGDFCLDRYLEIDPSKREASLETGLPVHNVVQTRSQPGAAGTILNNLAALGIGQIFAVGFCGTDGEGWELQRALEQKPGVRLDHFLATRRRRTFTYTKPLVLDAGKPPQELNRLDIKNWTPTPSEVTAQLRHSVARLADEVDALILLDQVDLANTGVVTTPLLQTFADLSREHPRLLILADGRRGLREFPPLTFKMNRQELARFYPARAANDLAAIQLHAAELARRNTRSVFVTLAEEGIIGADAGGCSVHETALPIRGPIDIVGAGDAVTANLGAALTAGASLAEAVQLANVAASIVIHQLGTTGTAAVADILALMPFEEESFERGAGRSIL